MSKWRHQTEIVQAHRWNPLNSFSHMRMLFSGFPILSFFFLFGIRFGVSVAPFVWKRKSIQMCRMCENIPHRHLSLPQNLTVSEYIIHVADCQFYTVDFLICISRKASRFVFPLYEIRWYRIPKWWCAKLSNELNSLTNSNSSINNNNSNDSAGYKTMYHCLSGKWNGKAKCFAIFIFIKNENVC